MVSKKANDRFAAVFWTGEKKRGVVKTSEIKVTLTFTGM